MLIRSLCLSVLLASALGAQEPVPAAPPAITDSTAPRADTAAVSYDRPNGALLRQGTIVYDLVMTRGTQVTALGIRSAGITESNVAGLPAWLLTETRTGSAVETSDSLYLSRAELAPLRWTAAIGRAQVGASFTRDTVFGALQSYQGRSSFAVEVGDRVLVTPGMVERVLELLPLRVGYRARATLLVVDMSSPRTLPAELLVDREESLTMVDRVVDCWVVTLRAGATEERLWVSKENSRVLKTEQAFDGGVLTAIARP